MASFDGDIVQRPRMKHGTTPTVVVRRYVNLWPARPASAP